MLNINNRSWENLKVSDIKKLLSSSVDENVFFEFKSDDEAPDKLVKEISAFANTFGGYIFLGVNDDKTIGGCHKWTEQRIHTTIHDSLTPTPNFDVRKFEISEKIFFVIKIEEGNMPPYITNKGQIFERISSGSFPIKDSSKLIQLYNKRKDQLTEIKSKIEIPEIKPDRFLPNNLYGYLDFGFCVTCSESTYLQKNFYQIDFSEIATYMRKTLNDFSIARLGHSYLFSMGKISIAGLNGKEVLPSAGINNFMEILYDGSVKCRIVLTGALDESKVNISWITGALSCFREIYRLLFGDRFSNIFISAHKYERLTVLKQFVPYHDFNIPKIQKDLEQYLISHQEKYGDNLIIEGNRIPKSDYILIDRQWFDLHNIKYNTENLFANLFSSEHSNLGYIDFFSKLNDIGNLTEST